MAPPICIPQKLEGCPPTNDRTDVESERVNALVKRLQKILKAQGARSSRAQIREFARNVAECETRSKRQKRFMEIAYRLPTTDILFWISEAHRNMALDEALWRGFLAAHFGRSSTVNSEKAQSTTKILCAFGRRPYWTWARVSSDDQALRTWLVGNRDALKSLAFGNHRKYEAHNPLTLHKVISSFIDWVKDNGGTPVSAFRTSSSRSPEANFDVLYHSVKRVFRFDRTGSFDLLSLLGNMGILPVRPGSCYLPSSTGPLKGARKLWGRRRPKQLNRLADSTAQALKIPFDVFEDALCMWQK